MSYDYIIVGSGAAGASAAKFLSEMRASVLILEEGKWFQKKDFKEDLFNVVVKAFRSGGNQVARGRSIIPLLQGCCVGGSTVINGAISHRLPRSVYEEWLARWKGKEAFSYGRLSFFEGKIISELQIAPTVLNSETLPVAKVIEGLKWKFEAMKRNAPGCVGSGNCLQGCPSGAKLSMERSYLPQSIEKGAILMAGQKVLKIQEGEVLALDVATGTRQSYRAKKGIILAAGAVHTPLILQRSGVKHPGVGRHFQCHLSFGVLARFSQEARSLEGQPQGFEATIPEMEGIKLATQLLPPELLFARSPILGREMTQALKDWRFFSSWMGSVRSAAEGRVRPDFFGRPYIQFTPSLSDMKKVKTAVKKLGELFFKLGAMQVYPGVAGLPKMITHVHELDEIDKVDKIGGASDDPRSYFLGAAHLFSTCQMGPLDTFPVDSNFEVRGLKKTYVLDASLFPSNTGVNPQLPIMALAMLGAEKIVERS